jgi:hypothetical protein
MERDSTRAKQAAVDAIELRRLGLTTLVERVSSAVRLLYLAKYAEPVTRIKTLADLVK